MSFSFSAAGTRQQVVNSLDALTSSNLGDGLGSEVRDLLIGYMEQGGEPGPGQRYVVTASGHSGSHAIMSLNVSVTTEDVQPDPVAQVVADVPLQDSGTGTEAIPAQEANV